MRRVALARWSRLSFPMWLLLPLLDGCVWSMEHHGEAPVAADVDEHARRSRAVPARSSMGRPVSSAPALSRCEPTGTWESTTLGIVGPREVVWNGVHRGARAHAPDGRATPYRTADGAVHLALPHFENARVSGRAVDALTDASSTTTYSSLDHASPYADSWSYREWIVSPYSDDGVHFFALAHSEFYRCLEHPGDRVRGCDVADNRLSSWMNAITLFRSDDGGASWEPVGVGRDHVVLAPDVAAATWPYWASAEPLNVGFFHPSNVVRDGDDYVSVVRQVHRNDVGVIDHAGLVMLRSTTPTDAASWHVNGVRGLTAGSPLPLLPAPPSADHASLSYNVSLCMWILMYFDYADSSLYVMASDKLESSSFSAPRRIEGQEFVLTADDDYLGGFEAANYAHMVDSSSNTYNFDISTSTPSLYFSSFRPDDVLRREVYRIPLALVRRYLPPDLPAGWFRVERELFRSDGTGGFCGPVSLEHAGRAGVSELRSVPVYERIPDGMTDGGACVW